MMDAPPCSQALNEMKSKTLSQTTWISLPMLVLACGGQAVDVGSNVGASGGSSATTGPGAGTGSGGTTRSGGTTGSSAGTGTGATTAGSGATAGSDATTGSGAESSGVGGSGNVIDPTPNCDTSTYPPGAPPDLWPDPASCQPGASNLQGTWGGYVQGPDAGLFPNEGNFKLDLQGDGDALCGNVIFGEPVTLPPVTDPDQGYLVEGGMYIGLQALKGFAYTLLDIEVSGERVTFGISLAEPYGAWCEQQTPYYDSKWGGGWYCGRNLATFYEGDRCLQKDVCSEAEYEVACTHHMLCTDLSRPCVCNAEGCNADVQNRGFRFDLRFEASEAEGELNTSLIFLERE
jgi:hypothetical protein